MMMAFCSIVYPLGLWRDRFYSSSVKFNIILIVGLMLATTELHSQVEFSKTYKLGYFDGGKQMWYDADRDVTLISVSSRCSTLLSCQHLLEVDGSGDVLNVSTFENIRASAYQEAVKVDDQIYYIGHPSPDTDSLLYLFRVIRDDDAAWEFDREWTYGLPDTVRGVDSFHIQPRMISMMADGNLLISSFWSAERPANWLMSIDTSDGGILWDTIVWTRPDQQQFQFIFSHPQADSTVYLQAVESRWWVNNRNQDYLTWYINTDGEILWQQRLPSEMSPYVPGHVGLQIDANGDMIRAHRRRNSAQVSRFGADREVLWTFIFDDTHPFFSQLTINNLTLAKNGDIIGAGTGILERSTTASTGWLFRLSPDGELLWSRKYINIASDYEFDSSKEDGGLLQVLELPDGDIMAVGANTDTLLQDGDVYQDYDVWLLRVDSDGCLEPDCEGYDQIITSIIDLPELDLNLQFSIFPNPVSDLVKLRLDEYCASCSYSLYSPSGQRMHHIPALSAIQYSIDVSSYAPGWYPWVLSYEGQAITHGSVMVAGR